jgi:nucleoid-associated protein YgaU
MSISKIFSMRIFVLLAALIAAPLVPAWGVKVAYEQLFKEGLVAPLARAGDGKGLPEPGEVVRYERLGPFDRAVHTVAKEEGDGILDLLRGREASGDQSRKEAVNGAVCPRSITRPWITLSAFAENGVSCDIEFRRSTDCETGKTSLSMWYPGVGNLGVPEDATGTLLALFEAWGEADRKALLAEPLPHRYVLRSTWHDGGTLSGVARLFYGDGNKWPLIWEANKAAVPDPDRLKPGTILVIPALPEGN